MAFGRAFADLFAFKIHAAHARLRGERNELRAGQFVNRPRADAEFFRQHDDAAAFGRFVGERGELRGVGQFLFRHAGRGQKRDGLAVAERDGAGLVEQQHVHVARRLDRASAHRQDIALEQTVHAGDADGAQQTADGRRNQANQQRDEHGVGKIHAGINAERFQRDDREQKHDRQRREQNRERDFVRRFLAARAFDERNHAVQKTFAGIGGDADFDFVREHARAAGDGAAVAAGLADDGRGFAGDGGFVHRRRAENDFAVGGNDFVGADDHDVAFAERIGVHDFNFAVGGNFVGAGARAGWRKRLGLRLAAALGDGFGEIREQHGEPEPEGDLRDEQRLAGRAENIHGADGRADHRHEHDGIFHHQARVQLFEGVADGRARESSGQKWKRILCVIKIAG